MAARLGVLLKRTISPRQPALAPPGEDCAGAKIEDLTCVWRITDFRHKSAIRHTHVAKVLKREETVPEAARAAVENILLGSTPRPRPQAAIRKAVKRKVLAEKKPPAEARAQRKKRKSRAIVRASNCKSHSSREIDLPTRRSRRDPSGLGWRPAA